MPKFIKQILYRYQKPPLAGYNCNRCGNWNRDCPECHKPTKLISHDPMRWNCTKCKKEFTIFQIDVD